MSHFYGSIEGGRGTATKGETKTNGLSGHIRGWNVGGKITVHHNETTGQDIVTVYATSGSHDTGHDVIIAEFTADTMPTATHADKIQAISQPGDYESMKKPSRAEAAQL